jgi:hypothetical protein
LARRASHSSGVRDILLFIEFKDINCFIMILKVVGGFYSLKFNGELEWI